MQPPAGQRVRIWMCLALCGLAALAYICDASPPATIAQVAPVSDLTAAAQGKIEALESALADEQSYLSNKESTLAGEAGVLAVLAQAVAESDGEMGWQSERFARTVVVENEWHSET